MYYASYFASGKKSLPKVKFDLTTDEVLVLPPARRNVFHGYSDEQPGGMHIDCYDFPEVFGEKVRALGERGRPRDLYDVVNLFRNDSLPAPDVVRHVLGQKCKYKEISIPILADIDVYREALELNWEPMLAHQLPALPSLQSYLDTLPAFFEWLEGETKPTATTLSSVSADGTVYRPIYGRLGLRTVEGDSLEIIRFAAGNRLCVDLDYTDNSGRRSSRVIEPYSLRQAKNGNILLYAVRVEGGQIRAYKIDQINNASITDQIFIPRYQVELSPGNFVGAIEQVSGSEPRLGIPKTKLKSVRSKTGGTRSKTSNTHSGPTYIFRCPVCDKTFRRKSNDSRLNPHKSKDGLPCSGKTGYYKGTTF